MRYNNMFIILRCLYLKHTDTSTHIYTITKEIHLVLARYW